MDRLIKTAWRAFWVGLGASAVLIGQSIFAPTPIVTPTTDPALAPVFPAPTPVVARPKAADPIFSNTHFDSKTRS
jgi:hypothetical protein